MDGSPGFRTLQSRVPRPVSISCWPCQRPPGLNGCDSGGHERNRTAGAQREREEGTQGGQGSVWVWVRKVRGKSGGQNAGLKLSRVDSQLPGFNSPATGCMLGGNRGFCRLKSLTLFHYESHIHRIFFHSCEVI